MPVLLHAAASPRGSASESLAIAGTFIDTLRDVRPDITTETLDLWDGTLPPFGSAAAGAKMAIFGGRVPAGAQAAAWAGVTRTFERFAAADYYLFSVPMWNHGIPYVLKQLIDVVSQPGMIFGFDPEHGYTGLLTGRKAVVVYTSAVYGEGLPPSFGADFQAPYFSGWLRWAGVTDITEIRFRPNLVTASADAGRQAAHAAAREAAKNL
jgi:FMN-dependent NADH-azoreductase